MKDPFIKNAQHNNYCWIFPNIIIHSYHSSLQRQIYLRIIQPLPQVSFVVLDATNIPDFGVVGMDDVMMFGSAVVFGPNNISDLSVIYSDRWIPYWLTVTRGNYYTSLFQTFADRRDHISHLSVKSSIINLFYIEERLMSILTLDGSYRM